MKIKTDFSEVWAQVDRIVENRLPPEYDMKNESAYENVRLLSEVMIKTDEIIDKTIVRSQELKGYDEYMESLGESGSAKDSLGKFGPDELYEETIKLNESLSSNEINALADSNINEFNNLNEKYKALTESVHESMKQDSNFFRHVKENYPEIFSEYEYHIHKEWRPKLETCIKNLELLPKEYHANKEAIMTYQYNINNKIDNKQYTTFVEKEQLTTLLNHSNQLLGQLEKPTPIHELQSENSHKMEL